MSSFEEHMADAHVDVALRNGLTIRFRRPQPSDVCPNPSAWVIFNLATVRAIDPTTAEGKAYHRKYDEAWEDYGKNDDNGYRLICATAIEPKVYDHRTGETPPEGAIPLYAIPHEDLTRIILELVCRASGMTLKQMEEEADRLANFRSATEGGARGAGDEEDGLPFDGSDPAAGLAAGIDATLADATMGRDDRADGAASVPGRVGASVKSGERRDGDPADHQGVVDAEERR